ncbi:MAG: hypothetical protein RL291_707 [Pseudomonadota bacterium]|jgi:hypothetical protein
MTPTRTALATLIPPPGRPIVEHLEHLCGFWAPDSAPHLLARACLDEMDRMRRAAAANIARAAAPSVSRDFTLTPHLPSALEQARA